MTRRSGVPQMIRGVISAISARISISLVVRVLFMRSLYFSQNAPSAIELAIDRRVVNRVTHAWASSPLVNDCVRMWLPSTCVVTSQVCSTLLYVTAYTNVPHLVVSVVVMFCPFVVSMRSLYRSQFVSATIASM